MSDMDQKKALVIDDDSRTRNILGRVLSRQGYSVIEAATADEGLEILDRGERFDIVFSLDSILTAVGLTDHYWIMAVAIIIAIIVMLIASERSGRSHNLSWRTAERSSKMIEQTLVVCVDRAKAVSE